MSSKYVLVLSDGDVRGIEVVFDVAGLYVQDQDQDQ